MSIILAEPTNIQNNTNNNNNTMRFDLKDIIEINTRLVDMYNQIKHIFNQIQQNTQKLFQKNTINDYNLTQKLYQNIQAFHHNFIRLIENQFMEVCQSFEELKTSMMSCRSTVMKRSEVRKDQKSSHRVECQSQVYSPNTIETTCVRRKRGSYRITNPIERIQALELANNVGIIEAAKKLNISTKNIKRWLKTGPDRKKGGGRKMLDPIMELKLSAWIKEREAVLGHPLTRTQIKNKARELSSIPGFKASKGWLDKFKKRSNVNFLPMFVENAKLKHEDESLKESSSTLTRDCIPNIKMEQDPNIFLEPIDDTIETSSLQGNFTMNFDLLTNRYQIKFRNTNNLNSNSNTNNNNNNNNTEYSLFNKCFGIQPIIDPNQQYSHQHSQHSQHPQPYHQHQQMLSHAYTHNLHHLHHYHHHLHQQQQQHHHQQTNELKNLDLLASWDNPLYTKSTTDKIMECTTNNTTINNINTAVNVSSIATNNGTSNNLISHHLSLSKSLLINNPDNNTNNVYYHHHNDILNGGNGSGGGSSNNNNGNIGNSGLNTLDHHHHYNMYLQQQNWITTNSNNNHNNVGIGINNPIGGGIGNLSSIGGGINGITSGGNGCNGGLVNNNNLNGYNNNSSILGNCNGYNGLGIGISSSGGSSNGIGNNNNNSNNCNSMNDSMMLFDPNDSMIFIKPEIDNYNIDHFIDFERTTQKFEF